MVKARGDRPEGERRGGRGAGRRDRKEDPAAQTDKPAETPAAE